MSTTNKPGNKPILSIPEGLDYAWATDRGKDEYGLFTAFMYKNITQGLRWIEPGEFMMGSPESEGGRYEEEYLHRVVLTQGFWIADTACTQELWEAVMGENPSRFKGSLLPVEQVTLSMCLEFIARLNTLIPGLGLRLPTEAEWEYACRAGTTTPFWFGETIIPEQVNYNGNYIYSLDRAAEFPEKTAEVKSLPCNSLGLYQMHGNVWEWCSDWHNKDYYKTSPLEDPAGPEKGECRIVRGGSFGSVVRDVRSACRGRSKPDECWRFLGFRLAR